MENSHVKVEPDQNDDVFDKLNFNDNGMNENMDSIDADIDNVPLFINDKKSDESVSNPQQNDDVDNKIKNISTIKSNETLNDNIKENNNNNNLENIDITPTTNIETTQTPIIVSPDSNDSPSQYIQTLAPLNPDKTPNNIHETYTLSNYHKNDTKNNQSNNNNDNNNTNSKSNNNDNDNKNNKIQGNANDYVNNIKESNHHENIYYNDIIAKDDLLDNISSENGKITQEISNKMLPANSLITSVKRSTNKKKSQSSIPSKRPAFVVKLWKMVNDPSNEHYISWMESGDAFQVKDRESFMKYVLPKYFKHNNLASFIRQLNMYGWHKIQDVNSGALVLTDEVLQFENPNFIRGREDLLDKIVRNKPSKENEDEEIDLKQLLSQLEQMKRNQVLISEDLRRVRQDNELLWKENFIARERHKIQSETLDKIMRFLASIYGNNTTRLIQQMNTNSGDLVELNQNDDFKNANNFNNFNNNINNNPNNNINSNSNTGNINSNINPKNFNSNSYPNSYGYFVSTGSTPLNSNNGNSNNTSNINISSVHDNSNLDIDNMNNNNDNNNTLITNNQKRQQTYNTSQYNKQLRKQLMITNQSHENQRSQNSNELRMNSVGYIPNQEDDIDSSIQEIHRGPETFNSNNDSIESITNFIETPKINTKKQHHLEYQQPSRTLSPSAQQQQQQKQQQTTPQTEEFVNTDLKNSKTQNYTNNQNFQDYKVSPNIANEQLYNQGTPISNMFDDSYDTNKSNNIDVKNSGDHQQIMGNIQQQLHKNQGTLKQVHDWLNKYNDNLDSDNISLPDEFKVDEFLQQPLEVTSTVGTPVDFNSMVNFIDPGTPIQTPVLTHSQLNTTNSKNTNSVSSNNDNNKRTFNQTDITNNKSSKRSRNV